MNMTAVEFDHDDEEINVDSDSRPGSPPVLQKPRLNFSISALLGGSNAKALPTHNRNVLSEKSYDDKRMSSPEHSDYERHEEDRDSGPDDDPHEDSYEEYGDSPSLGSKGTPSLLQSSYLAQLGPLASSLHASGLPLGLNPHSVLRVPAHRPALGYPPIGPIGGGAPPPWMGPHALGLNGIDRSTALAPHFPSLERLTGQYTRGALTLHDPIGWTRCQL